MILHHGGQSCLSLSLTLMMYTDVSYLAVLNIVLSLCTFVAPLSSLTGAIGATAASLEIRPSDLLRRLSGQVAKGSGPAEEAVVDEECPKCKCKGLSYHTAQLRGLDEGQTIFYTCLNVECQHKFNINS